MNYKKLLLVEDEEGLARLVALQLKSHDYQVDVVYDGGGAKEMVDSHNYDLILLDRMLPESSGLEILSHIRSRGNTPVIFVTALNSPEHIIEGLEAGADDYVTKPFDERVLLSRVRSVIRRAEGLKQEATSDEWLHVGEISVNERAFEARVQGEKVNLTRSEFLLLSSLVKDKGCVLTRKSLIGKVQGEDVNVTGRTVDTHIFGLRKKLGFYSEMIETIRGVGYRMKFYEDY